MKKTLWVLLFATTSFVSRAQVTTPAPSPAATVSTVVGLTTVKIDYSRPKAKGRIIFGTDPAVVVPYGQLWRTGANSGTKISFSDTVKIEGITVPSGEYLIFSTPGATEWTFSLYKDLSIGGNVGAYDKAKEAASFKVASTKLTEKVETLTFQISDLAEDNKSANVQLAWENTSVKFKIVVDYDKKVMQSIAANTKISGGTYYQSAVYYLETGRDLNQALTWINEASKSNPDAYWVLHQKAKIQKALGDKKGALATANASLAIATKQSDRAYQKLNEALIKSLN